MKFAIANNLKSKVSGKFLPSSLSSLLHWYRIGVGQTLDVNDNINIWTDQKGSNNLTGSGGNDQQPKDMAIISRVPISTLLEQYPEQKAAIIGDQAESQNDFTMLYYNDGSASWCNQNGDGKVVVEYIDVEGTYIFLPENRKIIDFIPNPLSS